MVMADRDGVKSASGAAAFLTMSGLAHTLVNGVARVPFRKPWQGPSGLLDNLGHAVTRQAARTVAGYSLGLPISEFRSMERTVDRLARAVLPPVVGHFGQVEIETEVIAGVEGIWCRAKDRVQVDDDGDALPVRATVLYLHGGSFFGSTPMMYSMFAAALVRISGCEVFIPDFREAPEFPFPAGMHDVADVYRALLDRGVPAEHLILAGDSSGGGLATSLIQYLHDEGLPAPAALALFSPEVDMDLSRPSITENATTDILPWSLSVAPYLRGIQPHDGRVSAVDADMDPAWYPPTFVSWGSAEMFRDGIEAFADRLHESGVPLKAIEEEGMFHIFPILMPWAEATKRVLRGLADVAGDHAQPVHPDRTAS